MTDLSDVHAAMIPSPFVGMEAALLRTEKQAALVAKFKPGSDGHRRATEVLVLLKDSAHAMAEARNVLKATRLAMAAAVAQKAR